MKRLTDVSRLECYTACLKLGACKAVVYWPAQNICYLKGEGDMIPGLKGREYIRPNFDNNNEGVLLVSVYVPAALAWITPSPRAMHENLAVHEQCAR